jgi:D-glycero-beta-D-manno-heptose 1-phosphate adenylyltransferase
VRDCKINVFNTAEELLPELLKLKKEGKKIVTTNGCFDLIHTGHVSYLREAASLGDILIVGINSDKSVQNLKGPGRPVQKEKDRALIIGSLKMVDYTFIFTEPDPKKFLQIIKPDIHVKGGDYTPESLPEREVVESNGGKIVIVSFVNGYSTTSIVNKICTPKT